METVDEEITSRALEWMETQAKADKPFFLWYNSTAMHFRTPRRGKESRKERAGSRIAIAWSCTTSRSA